MKISGRTRSLAVALAGSCAVLLLAAAGATAGVYTQYACAKPDGSDAGRDGFFYSRYGTSTGLEDTCPGGGSGYLAANLPDWYAGASYDPGSRAEWYYRVPAASGLTVKQLRLGRGADGVGGGIRFSIRDGAYGERDFCTSRTPQSGAACPSYGSRITLNDLGIGFSFGVECPASGSCSQPFSDARPEGRITGMAVDLEDSAAPVISNSPEGTGLFNRSSPRKGLQSVNYTAQDAGGGLYRAILRVDGQELVSRAIDANGGRCQTPFIHQVPCKTSPVNDSFNVDTAQLADGTHQVQLVVRDATDSNQAVYGPVEVTVDNVPPPAVRDSSRPTIHGSPSIGSTLTANPGEWSGEAVTFAYQWQRCDADGGSCADIGTGTERTYTVSSRDADHRLRVRVTGTNGEGSGEATSQPTPVIARRSDPNPAPLSVDSGGAPAPRSVLDRGAANGEGASDRARLTAYIGRGRSSTVRTRYGRSARITGQLLDPSNRPIAGATLAVLSESRAQGAQMEDAGSVRTDREGRFVYAAAAGPSRLVRFAYRSHQNDTQFADTTDVLVLVRAGVSLRPRPRKLRNGNIGTFAGRAQHPVPLRGVLVDLQVRIGRQWRTFAVARTSRTGQFRHRHRFRNTFTATTYKFRARIHRQADYPYIVGYSRTAKLRVRP